MARRLERPVDVEDVGDVKTPIRPARSEMQHGLSAAFADGPRVLPQLFCRSADQAIAVRTKQEKDTEMSAARRTRTQWDERTTGVRALSRGRRPGHARHSREGNASGRACRLPLELVFRTSGRVGIG